MTYFMPDEIWVGGIASVSELALVLPRQQHDETLLISKSRDACWATLLDPGIDQYHSFQISGDGTNRKGLIVLEIRIEIDQSSFFDTNSQFKVGSMIREKDRLSILALTSGAHGYREAHTVQIMDGLLSCDGGESAGFKRWRIVLGEGERQRILWDVDLERSESN